MASSTEIFISVTSADLGTCRQAIRKWVLSLGAKPVTFDRPLSTSGDTRETLRGLLSTCAVMVHVAGECYGPEPEQPSAGQPRRSTTQLEYEVARTLGLPIHAFLCLEGFPYDAHDAEPVALRSLQEAHRARLAKPRKVGDTLDLLRQVKKLRIPASRSMAAPPPRPNQPSRPWTTALAVSLLLLVLAGGLLGYVQFRNRDKMRAEALQQQNEQSEALLVAGRTTIESLANYCLSHFDFDRTAAPRDRLEAAYAGVAGDLKVSTDSLRQQVARYVTAVRASPTAESWDRTLCDFAELKFDAASNDAANAIAHFRTKRMDEEGAADTARRKAAGAGGRIKTRVTSTAAAATANEHAHDMRERESTAWLLSGHAAFFARHFREAASAYEKSLALWNENTDGVPWADSAQCLATAFYAQGMGEEAESMLRKAIDHRAAAVGIDHPANIQALRNLAVLLYSRGDTAPAEPIFRQVMEARKRTLGPEHSETIDAAATLAGILMKRGALAEAEPILREILAAQESTLSADDPLLLSTLNNLASVLSDKRDFAGAEPLFTRVVEARQRTLGRENPSTVASMSNLAALLTNEGDYPRAEPLFRQVLEIRRQSLGLDHPLVAASVNGLVMMLRAKGDQAACETLLREISTLQDEELGEGDATSLASANNLASQLCRDGKLSEAEPLVTRVLEACQKQFGDNRPETLNALKTMAYLRQSKGDYAGAEPIYRRMLAAQERLVGADQVETLSTVQNLANLLLILGRNDAADPFLQRALQGQERVLGKSHPDTALTAYSLASLRRKQGRSREALVFAREAVTAAQISLQMGDKNRQLYERQLAILESEVATQEKKALPR